MKKIMAGLLTALLLSSAASAVAATIPATDITSVDSTTPAEASLSDGTAKVTWQDNHAGAFVYSVAAVAAGNPTRFGSSPVCNPNGACSSNLIQLSGGVNYDVFLTVVDPSTGDSGQKSVKFLAHTVSNSPTPQTPSANGADVTLAWLAPTNLGGAGAISTYTITGGATPVTVQGNITSYVMQSLTYGQSYTFGISATNNIGKSVAVSFAAVTPVGKPDAPAAPTVSSADTSVTVNWTAPAANGSAITGYKVYLVDNATGLDVGQATSALANATQATIGGLSAGTYTAAVVATNAKGDSPRSGSSATVTVVPNVAPSIATATISGTAKVGQTLTAAATGVGGSPAPTETYQWKRGANNIANATASTYVVAAGDVGSTITVVVTETNGVGSAASATSSATSAVTAADASPAIGSATISGTAKVGSQLTATANSVTGSPTPTPTYQWKRSGADIAGATSSTYTLTANDLAATITVRVTETNGVGTPAVATSVATSAVQPADAAPTIAGVTVSGTAKVGQVLTSTLGAVTGSPTPTPTYQWKRDGAVIAGATSSSYTLVAGDLGAVITLVVTESNGVGSAATATSTGTAAVLPADAPPTLTSVSITGTATEGNLLQSTVVGTAGSPTADVTYQWKRAGTNISGATAATYTLVTADVGTAITVTVTYTNVVSAVSLTSSATAAVAALTPPPSGGSGGSTGGSSGGTTGGTGSTGTTPTPTQDTRPPVVTPTVDTRPLPPVVIAPNQSLVRTVDARVDTIVAITISADGTTPALSGVQLTLPAGQASDGAKVTVAPVANGTDLAKGVVTLNIQITDASGAQIKTFSKPLVIVLGKLNLNGLALVFSTDGVTWREIAKLAGTTLPADAAEGYYVDADGNVTILTTHLTYFGTKAKQAALTVNLSKSSGFINEVVAATTIGGNGTGAVMLTTSTPAVCSLTDGSLRLLMVGTCSVSATKAGDGTYLGTSSTVASITVVKATMSLFFSKVKSTVQVTAGTGYAGASVLLEYRKQGSSTWKLLAKVKLSANGTLKGKYGVPAKAKVRVSVAGVVLASVNQ